MKSLNILFFILGFALTINSSSAQSTEDPKYNLDLVKMIITDTTYKNDVLVVLAVTPIKKKDFPPVLSMRIGYKVNNGDTHEFINLQKQERKTVSLVIYGKSLPEKNPKLYNQIKDEINLDDFDQIQLLAFQFYDISEVKIEEMSVIYGLWEKRNTNNRIEKTFIQAFPNN